MFFTGGRWKPHIEIIHGNHEDNDFTMNSMDQTSKKTRSCQNKKLKTIYKDRSKTIPEKNVDRNYRIAGTRHIENKSKCCEIHFKYMWCIRSKYE